MSYSNFWDAYWVSKGTMYLQGFVILVILLIIYIKFCKHYIFLSVIVNGRLTSKNKITRKKEENNFYDLVDIYNINVKYELINGMKGKILSIADIDNTEKGHWRIKYGTRDNALKDITDEILYTGIANIFNNIYIVFEYNGEEDKNICDGKNIFTTNNNSLGENNSNVGIKNDKFDKKRKDVLDEAEVSATNDMLSNSKCLIYGYDQFLLGHPTIDVIKDGKTLGKIGNMKKFPAPLELIIDKDCILEFKYGLGKDKVEVKTGKITKIKVGWNKITGAPQVQEIN